MSLAITTCEHCEEEYELGYNAEYCSEECAKKAKGTRVLNLLKHDHRFCFSCLTRLKEVERPTDEQLRSIEGVNSKEAVVGFQYPTENADHGEKTAHTREDRKETVRTGIVCGNCGCTDHRDDFQREFSIQEAAKRLRERIRETRAEGQHSWKFDTEAFVEAWNESKDWEYSLGSALQ